MVFQSAVAQQRTKTVPLDLISQRYLSTAVELMRGFQNTKNSLDADGKHSEISPAKLRRRSKKRLHCYYRLVESGQSLIDNLINLTTLLNHH